MRQREMKRQITERTGTRAAYWDGKAEKAQRHADEDDARGCWNAADQSTRLAEKYRGKADKLRGAR